MADLKEYVRELEARRAKGETVPELTVGRIVNGKYFVNNQEVTKEQYDRANADSSEAIRKIKEQPTPGLEDLESFATRSRTLKGVNRPSMEERRRSALSELDGMKKGGKAKMLKSKITTTTKSKKSPAW